VVLGRSFGGFVAQQYAAAYPQHPSGLILMAASPRFPGTEQIVARFREVGGDHAAEVMRRELETPSDQTAAEWARVCGRPALRNVRCPTLVIVGEHDPLIPVNLAQEIVAAIPDTLGRLVVIPGAAHTPETDNPAATFDVIHDFMVTLPPPHPAHSSHTTG
jgi:pimeloyl-ACP methyl ester carboxylesterase